MQHIYTLLKPRTADSEKLCKKGSQRQALLLSIKACQVRLPYLPCPVCCYTCAAAGPGGPWQFRIWAKSG